MTGIAICNGIIRSGSTWSFNVCQLMLRLVAQQQQVPFVAQYLDEAGVAKFLRQQADTPGIAAIKAHFVGPLGLEWIRAGRIKAVCTFRDPRDCVVSDMAFMGKGFDAAVARVAHSLNALAFYQDFGRTLFIRYEEMIRDTVTQIRRIAAHLDLGVDEKSIGVIDAQTNLNACRDICQGLQQRPKDKVMVMDDHRIDPATQLHDNHIGAVNPGRWRQDLTPDQALRLTRQFHSWLCTLGYESEESLRFVAPSKTQRGQRALIAASSGQSGGVLSRKKTG